jgi:CelD/BcsL family acetyltransferase involved in cellulose biosynthesis
LVDATARAPVSTDSEIVAILASRAERPPFLHPAWLQVWLAEWANDREPVILRAGGAPAYAALLRDDDRLTFLGDSSVCDYMDFVLPEGASDADYEGVWAAVRDEEWSELELWGIAAHSPTRAQVERLAAASGYSVEAVEEDIAPRVTLAATWEDYLAGLGKKDRHELRRKLNRLANSGRAVSLRVLSSQSEVAAAMDDFLRLHRASRADKAEFMTPAMETFFRRMASVLAGEGLVRLFMLDLDGAPVATVLCLDAGSWLYMYNSGYDPAFSALSVGVISKAHCLRWAIENGKQGLDFLRGNEPYKYDLGGVGRPVYRLTVRR